MTSYGCLTLSCPSVIRNLLVCDVKCIATATTVRGFKAWE